MTTPPPLTTKALLFRLAAIGVVVGCVALAFAFTGGWLSPAKLTPSRVIDTFEKLNGEHPGFRRNHAKGVCFRGTFESNGQGAALSKSVVFQPGKVPVIGRFALAGGMPFQTDAPGTVRSMAIQFQLPNGEEWRTGINNIPVFPVLTGEEFNAQMIAFAPDSATGKPDPAKMKAFLDAHPATAKALPLIINREISTGFANSTYNSLNAFQFIAADGKNTPVRWAMVPEQPFAPIDKSDPGKSDKNYLFDALIAAVHSGPQRWKFIVTIGDPSDSTSDSTVPWPADRKTVDVGTLVIDSVESEDVSPARDITFDPLILPNGIAPSDDPVLSARSATYSQSFTRREGEPKTPSAVSTAETKK
jgi:catalase